MSLNVFVLTIRVQIDLEIYTDYVMIWFCINTVRYLLKLEGKSEVNVYYIMWYDVSEILCDLVL